MDSIIELYRDPMFLWFPLGATLVSVVSFALFAIPLTYLARVDHPALRRYRLQPRRRAESGAGGRPIIGPSVRMWLVNTLAQLIVVVLAWPLLRLSAIHLGPPPPAWVVLTQVVLFIYLDDFLYYWMHRAMHRPWLYRRVHGLHHRVPAPWAIAGHYMHPVEYVLTAALMLVGPLLLGAHIVTLYVWIAVRQWEASEGHCGYDLPFSPLALLPFCHGAAHHDFHHSRRRGNFGGFLPLWDRVFGTQARGYAEYVAERTKR